MLESAGEIAVGVLVEAAITFAFGAVLYRALAGRFLIPKREMVLPYHRAVLIGKSGETRVVEAGGRWVRPGEKLIICDARPRTLRIEGYQALSADGAVMRLCFSGEYKLTDPLRYLAASANASERLQAQVRRTIAVVCRRWTSAAALGNGAHELMSKTVLEEVRGSSAEIGLEMSTLQIWELIVLVSSANQTNTGEGLLQ